MGFLGFDVLGCVAWFLGLVVGLLFVDFCELGLLFAGVGIIRTLLRFWISLKYLGAFFCVGFILV